MDDVPYKLSLDAYFLRMKVILPGKCGYSVSFFSVQITENKTSGTADVISSREERETMFNMNKIIYVASLHERKYFLAKYGYWSLFFRFKSQQNKTSATTC